MLPALPPQLGNLRKVFPAVFDSISGEPNDFGLRKIRHAIVLVIDGLGYWNLKQASNHAPLLSSGLGHSPELFCGFPSSTVASITSLATGQTPSQHGLFGYKIYDRSRLLEANLLSGQDQYSILDYLRCEPFSTQRQTYCVTLPEYLDSGFTRATMHMANQVGRSDLHERFMEAGEIANSVDGVTYLYVPELDQIAHAQGWKSDAWNTLLAKVDRMVSDLVMQLKSDVGLLVTADHGVLDIEQKNHMFLDDVFESDSILSVGGDPRATFVYLKQAPDEQTLNRLNDWAGSRLAILTPSESVALGLYDEQVLAEDDLLPDLILISLAEVAIYHRELSKPKSMMMVGQHGSISATELALPLIKLAGYSSSDFVP